MPAHSAGRGSNGSHVHNSGSEAGGGERAHSAGRGSSDGHALSAKREAGGGHGLGAGAGRVIKAVIFDLDGTLIDSMGVWERIDAEFLAKRGIAVPDGYVDAIATLGAREAAEYTIARFGLPDSADELVSEWNRMAADEYAHKVKLKPYAKEYLAKLRRGGIKLGVATCLHTELRLLVMENNGISKCFDAICNSDDVAAGKDSPDIFLRAAELLETPPENCLVFEDLPRALRSAKRAGMMAYGVLDASSAGQWEELRRVADGTIRDFRDAPTF
ncbi:MAG: HAD family phosphatase [Clostridiales Family XIII bacterium]|nr:HAD family phosphatase [Clostridiales Family XIII bacterium]